MMNVTQAVDKGLKILKKRQVNVGTRPDWKLFRLTARRVLGIDGFKNPPVSLIDPLAEAISDAWSVDHCWQ